MRRAAEMYGETMMSEELQKLNVEQPEVFDVVIIHHDKVIEYDPKHLRCRRAFCLVSLFPASGLRDPPEDA